MSIPLSGNEAVPQVVLDTNVVLDWLLFRASGVLAVAAALQSGRLRWIACPVMRTEFAHVAARPMVTERGAHGQALLAAFDRWAVMHEEPAPSPGGLRCRDASDQPFLDLALSRRAPWLITRDRALLALAGRARRLGLHICVPERWPGLPDPAGR